MKAGVLFLGKKKNQKEHKEGIWLFAVTIFTPVCFSFFGSFFSLYKGAKPSAACGRGSEAQHGQNTE